jgi:CRISPR-associated protein Cas1
MLKIWKPIHNDPTIQWLTSVWLQNGMKTDADYEENTIGIPQGNSLSPILSNLYLTSLDTWIVQSITPHYIRYADDLILLFDTEAQAHSALSQIQKFLKSLSLSLNEDSNIQSLDEPIEYLGTTLIHHEITLSKQKADTIISRWNQTAIFDHSLKLHPKFLEKIEGVSRYYGKLVSTHSMLYLDHLLHQLYLHRIAQWRKEWSAVTRLEAKKAIFILPYFSAVYQGNAKQYHNELWNRYRGIADEHTTPLNFLTKQKRDVRKEQLESKEIVVAEYGAFLSISKGILSIKVKNKSHTKIKLKLIESITILSTSIGISGKLVSECSKLKIPILIFGKSGQLRSTILPHYVVDAELVLAQISSTQNIEVRHYIAKSIILSKANNQIKLLKHYYKYHKKQEHAFSKDFLSALQKMETIYMRIKELVPNPHEEKYNNALMIQEAQIAQIYWTMYGKLAEIHGFHFEGRETKGAQNPINQMLNYGYGILYARITEILYKEGLQPHFSYLHAIHPQKPTLSYDIIEQYRSWVVDKAVIWYLSHHKEIKTNDQGLAEQDRIQFTQKVLDNLQSYSNFRGKNIRIGAILSLQIKDLCQYIKQKQKTLYFFNPKW